jgi:hypothetical protein
MFLITVPEVLPDRVNQDLGFDIIEWSISCRCHRTVFLG